MIASTPSIGFRPHRQLEPVGASSPVAPDYRASGCKRTTILRQFARKLAESANASERKIGLKEADAARKIGYFLRFVRTLGFEERLFRM